MKLTRLRISQIRQFRGTLEIPAFAAGLNLFCGPNEAGKSTVIRAIRAAFFERYRSSVIDDLIPRGEPGSAVSPTIDVTFDLGPVHCHLVKTFFSKKRCSLSVGETAFDGEQAEERLAQLLGFGYANKGASKPDHWGIPGLLWIQQGEGHRVHDAVSHATDHLRTALESTLGAVASSSGDDILSALRSKRELLLTKGSQPRGIYAEVASQLAEQMSELQALDTRIANYREDVDRLAALRREHDADARDKPWEKFKTRLEEARGQLAAADQLKASLTHEQDTLAQVDRAVALMVQQLADDEARRLSLARRDADQLNTHQALETADDLRQGWEKKKTTAQQAVDIAAAGIVQAEQEERRRALAMQISVAERNEGLLATRVAEGEAEAIRLQEHTAAKAGNAISESDVKALRGQSEHLRDLLITRQAASTTLDIDFLDKVKVVLDGAEVPHRGEHRIHAAAHIDIEGVGRLTVTPGVNDLDELAAAIRQAEAAVQASLGRLGVASLEMAVLLADRHRQASAGVDTSTRLLKNIAPAGLDALRAERVEATTTRTRAQAALQALPGSPAGLLPSLPEARNAHAIALATLDQATLRHNDAVTRQATARSEARAAEREAEELRASLHDPDHTRRQSDLAVQLLEARNRQRDIRATITAMELRVRESGRELLEQDVARYTASAEQAMSAFNQREGVIRNLEGRLEADGTSGIEELRGDLLGRVRSLERRHQELARRAAALDLLVTRLDQKRQALTRRLQAPLQRRLAHYVQILFPQGSLELGENLSPAELTRSGPRGVEVSSFAELSHGAQEQTGLVSRLAYADLLKEAGKPTLVILDDALVHSDAARLEQMKRVIFDTAQRHQVLLFTCHPERWDGLGVAPQQIRSFVT